MKEDDNEYKINLTGDPVTNFLLKKLDYFMLFVLMFIIMFVVPVLLGFHYGTLLGAPPALEIKKAAAFVPQVKDYLGQILAILTIAVLLLTKDLFDKIEAVFSSFPQKQILKLKDLSAYEKFLKQFEKYSNNGYIFLFCLLVVPNLTFTPFAFSQSPIFRQISTTSMWFEKESFPFSWAYWFAVLYFLWFGLSLLISKLFVTVKHVRLLAKFGYNVQIMHPDRCGGFKSIGDLCLKIDMIIFAIGLAFASMTYFIRLEDQPQLLFFVAFYICASFFFFFYPIMDMHSAMQNHKTEIMNKISMKLQNHPAFYEQTIDKDGNIDNEALKKLQDIRKINQEISKIPVWPFDSETLWKFVSTTSIPVIAVILNIVGVR